MAQQYAKPGNLSVTPCVMSADRGEGGFQRKGRDGGERRPPRHPLEPDGMQGMNEQAEPSGFGRSIELVETRIAEGDAVEWLPISTPVKSERA